MEADKKFGRLMSTWFVCGLAAIAIGEGTRQLDLQPKFEKCYLEDTTPLQRYNDPKLCEFGKEKNFIMIADILGISLVASAALASGFARFHKDFKD